MRGYIDNSVLKAKDINSSHAEGGRFALRATPTERLTIDLLAIYHRFESDAGNAVVDSAGA